MPKKKTRKTSYSKRKSTKNNFLGWIIFAVALFALILYLSHNPESSSKSPQEEKEPPAKVSKNQKVKEEQPTANVAVPDSLDAVEAAIVTTAHKLGVQEKKMRHKTAGATVYYFIALPREAVDLTFANMILKGAVESAGGTMLKGEDNTKSRSQTLTFTHPNSRYRYVVEIYYDEKVEQAARAPKLVLIIDDFGYYNGDLLDQFCATDPNITFAIIPYTRYAKTVMHQAVKAGHETIIHIPMEPLDFPKSDPGDKAIFVQHSDKEISKRMKNYIDQLPLCVGANNHMGSFATSDENTMRVVMRELKENNLYFVDSRTTSTSVAYSTAQRSNILAFKRDLFLDDPDMSSKVYTERISQLAALKGQPYVVAIMHCHTTKHLQYMNRFIAQAKRMGFVLTRPSQVKTSKLPAIL